MPERAIYMRLPSEMGLPSNVVARQVRCFYGTSGKVWEDCDTQVLEVAGLRQEFLIHVPVYVILPIGLVQIGTQDVL